MSSGKVRNLTCRVHPLVPATIFDAYIRRQEGNTKCLGTLMGYVEGNSLVISDAFVVLHKENEGTGTLSLDKEYHKKLVAMKKKVCPTESVVGWFSTCDELEAGFVAVHAFYGTPSESKFVSSQLLPSPVFLTVDPSLSSGDLNMKVSIMQTTVGADSLVQFHQLSLEQGSKSFESMGCVLSVLAENSELPHLSPSTLKEDLEAVACLGAADAKLAQEVAMAVQAWKSSGKSEIAVSEEKELTATQEQLLDRVSTLLASDHEIVI